MLTQEYLELTNYCGYKQGCIFSNEILSKIQRPLKTYIVYFFDKDGVIYDFVEYYAKDFEILEIMLKADYIPGTKMDIFETTPEFVTTLILK